MSRNLRLTCLDLALTRATAISLKISMLSQKSRLLPVGFGRATGKARKYHAISVTYWLTWLPFIGSVAAGNAPPPYPGRLRRQIDGLC